MIERLIAQSSSPMSSASPSIPLPVATSPIPASPIPLAIPQSIMPAVSSPNIWQYILLFVYFLVCVTLVTLVLTQTSKSEGLTGTLGGTTQSVFAGKRSFEEKINKFTTGIAVAFILLSILIAFLAF